MFIVQSYALAVVLCVITMICWGSWGNTQKMAAKSWRYELFYWDYVIGILLFSVLVAFTLGSIGKEGRSFIEDISQVAPAAFGSALLGGVIFNASNILLSASVSIAGMSVAFPVGVGLALALGVVNNYVLQPKGDPMLLFGGMALVLVAIVLNGVASARKPKSEAGNGNSRKGIVLAVCAGILMAFFYRFVAAAMDLDCFENPAAGKATPYTAFFIFALGVFISNFVFNTLCMKKPFVGEPVSYRQYFKGSAGTHLVGLLGGCIWGLGSVLSYISAGKAGAAISYALGQGAPMIAAIWGIFIWKEFKGSDKATGRLLGLMFVFFITGLACIVLAGN
ncbi:MAG: multidrug DMT transporter permease [Bacteroidaceae bacterium]|nr:multidrug DMT transporter permease [Bacteroidaceae bacterium]MBO4590385.1 multidrug DMT transporter permease [Bacteroidaceae bacterium]MBR5963732.1 multidrug DMT transporter permease [Bacteroidaceae bacterium]